MKILVETNTRLLDASLLLLRCAVGLILFVAGVMKVFGWFGGMGMEATIDAFARNIGIPAYLAYLSSYTEFIGGIFLIIGLLTRPAALAITINMLVATIVMGSNNFFTGGGAYPFSLMISSVVILLAGPMSFSLDAWIVGRLKEEPVQ